MFRMREMAAYVGLLAGTVLASVAAYGADAASLAEEWRGRVIPCPKTCEVVAVHATSPGNVALILPDGADPKYDNIRALLTPFAGATISSAPLSIMFALRDTAPTALLGSAATILATAPNADQAYVIVPRQQAGAFAGLLVCANTNLGLLYGARTLSQMLKAEPGVLPELTLTDWPDMLERGQWGGSSTRDLAWLAARKFNVVEAHATLSCDDSGTGTASLPESMRAEWAKNLAETHFPNALHIVDFYHAAEHVARLAKLLYERNPKLLEAQRERWTEDLYEGRVQSVIDQASALLSKDPGAMKDARKEITYLIKNKDRMRYDEYRAQHIFIGSGVIEAACKHLIGQRLKQSGMEWTVRGANAIIALRCAILSNRFEDFWEQRLANAI